MMKTVSYVITSPSVVAHETISNELDSVLLHDMMVGFFIGFRRECLTNVNAIMRASGGKVLEESIDWWLL